VSSWQSSKTHQKRKIIIKKSQELDKKKKPQKIRP